MLFSGKWMELEILILSEKSQAPKDSQSYAKLLEKGG
jgi:hypothetical protein